MKESKSWLIVPALVFGILFLIFVPGTILTALNQRRIGIAEADLATLRTNSSAYLSQSNGYAGFCSDPESQRLLGNSGSVHGCNDSSSAWAAYELMNGAVGSQSYWCVDSVQSGAAINAPLNAETSCIPQNNTQPVQTSASAPAPAPVPVGVAGKGPVIVSVSPNPVAVGGMLTITGSGFAYQRPSNEGGMGPDYSLGMLVVFQDSKGKKIQAFSLGRGNNTNDNKVAFSVPSEGCDESRSDIACYKLPIVPGAYSVTVWTALGWSTPMSLQIVAETSDWKTYSDADRGFSLGYPSDWTYQKVSCNVDSVAFCPLSGNGPSNCNQTCNNMDNPNPSPIISLALDAGPQTESNTSKYWPDAGVSLEADPNFENTFKGMVGSYQFIGPKIYPKPTATLNFSPAVISKGGSSTISWSVTNAEDCFGSNEPDTSFNWSDPSVNGGAQTYYNIQNSLDFKLTCGNGVGKTRQEVVAEAKLLVQ